MDNTQKHFTHLHLHTDYSLLDGAISINALVDFGKKHGFKALAISDHGNIFGAVRFFEACKAAGIKPILAMEAYLAPQASVKNVQQKYYHQLLIVENEEGYRNLCKLISFSYQKGFYFKPRIDYELLKKHAQGLIATSTCLGGHIPKLLMDGQEKAAHEQIDWFLNVFGPDRFYLEVQPEDQPIQATLNNKLYTISQERSIHLVATGDCHYVSPEDREAHEIMLAIQTHDKMTNPDRYTFGDCRVHMRNTNDMLTIFKDHQDAVWNSGVIADRCSFQFSTGKLFFPQFDVPISHTPASYFTHLCYQGLQELINKNLIPLDDIDHYKERLEIEIALIINVGFVGYFLVVSDFIQWAHNNGIPVGPGRGSAAGSLVAWCLKITNINPIKYHLLFERFLNPERVSMPDIDIDFCIEGRERVVDYIRTKYGKDNVCYIITFGTMLAKGVIKDVARSIGIPFEDSNALTALIPDQLKITLEEAVKQEPRLQELITQNPKIKHLFDIALKLEGKTRHASKHAAGIVISPQPIDEVLPVYIPADSDELVAQYAMTELELLGFLKIDLLGLKNLTLIKRVLTIIEKEYDIIINMDTIPLDDAKTFELICAGNTSGVFQLESTGLKDVLRKLQPNKFEDIIAVNALYRPGPLGSGMVDDFIQRRHGKQEITYLFPELAPILEETYGVIVYQEQVMKIASTIAGYSLGESDILRRAMGKKKASVMAEQHSLFVQKAIQRGFDGKKAGELFDLMAYFAGYGFNKSHSAAYALIAYQTAYLKAQFPAAFMSQLISLDADNPDKMTFYLTEARDMGIAIKKPNIHLSQEHFTITENSIIFGLNGIKNVGQTAINEIISARSTKHFVDLSDFCKRVDMRIVNKRVIEQLIYAGAFDELPGNRAQKIAELSNIMDSATTYKRDRLSGQLGLFNNAQSVHTPYEFAPLPELSNKDLLQHEKDAIGFYVSSHPLDSYQQYLKWFEIEHIDTLTKRINYQSSSPEKQVLCAGLIIQKKEITTKKGDRMAFLQCQDHTGSIEIVLFPKLFTKIQQTLNNHEAFIIGGVVDNNTTSGGKIKASFMVPIESALTDLYSSMNTITFSIPPSISPHTLDDMKKLLQRGTIPVHLMIEENGKKLRIKTKHKTTINETLLTTIESWGIKGLINL